MGKEFFYLSENCTEILKENGLDDFEALWNAEVEIVDEPNIGRGGYSDVGILRLPNGSAEEAFFVKRQTNHNCRTFWHPFRGIPLAIREWLNINRLQKAGIQTLEVACIGRHFDGGDRAILVTRALNGFQTIREWLSQKPDETQRERVMMVLGKLIGKMHRAGIRHGSLYRKHIFVSIDTPEDIRFIDLEKSKSIWSKRSGLQDFVTFLYRTSELKKQDKEKLMTAYVDAGPDRWGRKISKEAVNREMIAKAAKSAKGNK